jgi:hypothetical protein
VLRAVISFLVAVPLLAPPGVCACRFSLPEPARVSSESDGLCRTSQRACCAHRKVAAGHNLDHRDSSRQSAPSQRTELPAGPGETHEPGCPALLTADHAKLSRPNNAAAPVIDVQQASASTIEAAPTMLTALTDTPASAPASCPLYLSLHCLLI